MLDAAWRPHPLPLIPTHPASSYTCTFVNEIFERSVVHIMINIVFFPAYLSQAGLLIG